jgi:hypothetical protein
MHKALKTTAQYTYNFVMGFVVGFTGAVLINKVVDKLSWK